VNRQDAKDAKSESNAAKGLGTRMNAKSGATVPVANRGNGFNVQSAVRRTQRSTGNEPDERNELGTRIHIENRGGSDAEATGDKTPGNGDGSRAFRPFGKGAPSTTCAGCHDSDHSPRFQFAAYLEKVKH